MTIPKSRSKVGVYADVANMYRNGGQRLQYDVLREFACRDQADPLRLNAYVTFDAERAKRDHTYRDGATSFHSKLRDYGYRVVVKEINWYRDEAGNHYGKADADLDLAVDALLQSENLDKVLIATGDGDFANVIRALQNKGLRVEIVGLNNSSRTLQSEADMFFSGFCIPNMIPMLRSGTVTPPPNTQRPIWGEEGSRVRGWCYWYESERGFGYMRFLTKIAPGLWFTDARHPESPFETAFFHASLLPSDVRPANLPNRDYVFEFEVGPSERGDGLQATDIEIIQRA